MLTLFTAPKPFAREFAVIQRNALRSWTSLPGCELIVFGDEEGVREAAVDVGAAWLPDVARTQHGTPLVNDMFGQARENARQPFLCFVNADIILTSSLLDAVRRVQGRRFLLVGRRWDIQVAEELEFADDWETALLQRVRAEGRLHPPAGSDYFVFPRDTDWQMPPFAVGRVHWDNWTLYRARQLGLDVIDATRVVSVIHQDHEHSPAQHPPRQEMPLTPEAAENVRLAANRGSTLNHATRVMTARWILPAIEPGRLIGRMISSRAVGYLRRVPPKLRRLAAR